MSCFYSTKIQEMSDIRTLKSQKGEPMVVHRGFIYTLERRTTVKCIFRCQNRNCKGKDFQKIFYKTEITLIYFLARCHTNLSINKFMSDPTVV